MVFVPGELPVGELVPVRIDGAMTYDLTGCGRNGRSASDHTSTDQYSVNGGQLDWWVKQFAKGEGRWAAAVGDEVIESLSFASATVGMCPAGNPPQCVNGLL